MSNTTIPTWTLGNRLAKVRDDAGLTTYELAELLGVSRTTVTNWENNTTAPKRYAIEAWARLCGDVDPMWIVTGLSEDQMAEVERLGAEPGSVVVVPIDLHGRLDEHAASLLLVPVAEWNHLSATHDCAGGRDIERGA